MDDVEFGRTLGRIESKVDAIHERLSGNDTVIGKHGDKIQSLERWRSWITGAMAVILGILGWILKG